jgi:mRNA interferase MazF
VRRGEVWYADLPVPSGEQGHEQIGMRPVVIVLSDLSPATNPMVMIVPLTSQQEALRFPHTISVLPSPQNGLTLPSVLLVFQMRAVSRARFKKRIGLLEERIITLLDQEIKYMVGLGD